MSEQTATRAPRRDVARNHELLLTAAAEIYAENGIEASLDLIAKRAGVGIGTLYRHFPNRLALHEAVYRRQVEMLCDGVDELLAEHAPLDALSIWMRRFAGYVARKRGMATALKSALTPDSELRTYTYNRIRDALGALVSAAIASGDITDQADPEDLLRGMSGICMATESPDAVDRTERTERLIGLLIDGLRFRALSPA